LWGLSAAKKGEIDVEIFSQYCQGRRIGSSIHLYTAAAEKLDQQMDRRTPHVFTAQV
jgi:predicted alpha-1,6-mannanase (GH76 family)